MTPPQLEKQVREADLVRNQGLLPEAISLYREAIRQWPDQALGHYKLGTALMRSDLLSDAEACFRQALHLDRDYPEAANNLGLILAGRRGYDEAEAYYRRALALAPDLVEVHLNLGDLLYQTARFDEAIYHYKRTLVMQPANALAFQQLGQAVFDLGRTEEAFDALTTAVKLEPALASAWTNLGRCHSLRGEHEKASECYRRSMAENPNAMANWHNLLFAVVNTKEERQIDYELHSSFGSFLRNEHRYLARTCHSNSKSTNRRLRVGFVSGDFRRHSVSHFIEAPLRFLDRRQFEVWAYYSHPREDSRTAVLKELFDEWRNVTHLSDQEFTRLVEHDGIDILVDLAGHTGNSRLPAFGLKPAPIQISWIGYPNTTGMSAIDYRITDGFTDPVGIADRFHVEKLIRLPNSFLCYTPPAESPEVEPPPCIADRRITFGSFNSRAKINDDVLAAWSRVLESVPDSRLAIKSVGGISDPGGREHLLRQMERNGIPRSRVDLLSVAETLRAHLEAYRHIDVCLDTFPYNGTTTTCEALWMGVPVVVLAGDRHASRVGISLLSNVGLQQHIASDVAEYVRISRDLASDVEQLSMLRSTMRARLCESPLLNGAAIANHLGTALQDAWRAYCATPEKESPDCRSSIEAVVSLAGDIRIGAGDDCRTDLATWVCLEQETWFEDELLFVQEICRPGWTAIDTWAGRGFYSLALAKAGARRVWALEPTREARLRLRNDVARNDAEGTVQIVDSGLSDGRKSLVFDLAVDLMRGPALHGERHETVELESLDDLLDKGLCDGEPVDFVRIDAEGAEVAALRGGARFFCEQSPLVMFKFKHGRDRDPRVARMLRAFGYDIYRLIPGIRCLAFVAPGQEEHLDPFVLNLFACKPSRTSAINLYRPAVATEGQLAQRRASLGNDWPTLLPTFDRSAPGRWWSTSLPQSSYMHALASWCNSRRSELSPDERLGHLQESISRIEKASAEGDEHPAVAILAIRCFSDAGQRATAVNIAAAFVDQTAADDCAPVDRPVPPADPSFDERAPTVALGTMLNQSVLEFLVKRSTFSGFFSLPRREHIARGMASPERSAEFERRAILAAMKNGDRMSISLDDLKISRRAGDHRNPECWRRLAPLFLDPR